MSYSIITLLINKIPLFDCPYFSRYWSVPALQSPCFPGCDVINFEINLIFLIKPSFYMTKTSRQKFEYLENEKSFYSKMKSVFYYFYSL